MILAFENVVLWHQKCWRDESPAIEEQRYIVARVGTRIHLQAWVEFLFMQGLGYSTVTSHVDQALQTSRSHTLPSLKCSRVVQIPSVFSLCICWIIRGENTELTTPPPSQNTYTQNHTSTIIHHVPSNRPQTDTVHLPQTNRCWETTSRRRRR